MYLWVPDVKYSRIRCSDNLDIAPDVFSIKRYVLSTPSNDVLVEATNPEKVRPREKMERERERE